jgi:hypothetical protein
MDSKTIRADHKNALIQNRGRWDFYFPLERQIQSKHVNDDSFATNDRLIVSPRGLLIGMRQPWRSVKVCGGTDPHIKAQWHDYYHSFDKHV